MYVRSVQHHCFSPSNKYANLRRSYHRRRPTANKEQYSCQKNYCVNIIDKSITSLRVVHTTTKQLISRRGKNGNVYEMYTNEKCTCEACNTIVFHRLINMQICDVHVAVVVLLAWFSYKGSCRYYRHCRRKTSKRIIPQIFIFKP